MSDEKVFVDGMIVKRRDNAPDFVICNLSLKGAELVEFMRQHQKDGWVNINILRSRGGKLYAELDTWEPSPKQVHDDGMTQAQAAVKDEDFQVYDIPF